MAEAVTEIDKPQQEDVPDNKDVIEDVKVDVADKKVGCGGMRRGIWLGGWHTINQGWPAYQVF